jgi:HEAT repeat protein
MVENRMIHRGSKPVGISNLAGLFGSLLICACFSLPAPQAVQAQVPGPELFAKDPSSPLELWDAIDYLIRTEQIRKAIPYLEKFTKIKPDDPSWMAIRNRFGFGSILRLNDDPLTRRFAEPVIKSMADAVRRFTSDPERIKRFVSELTGTPDEQDYAVRHLREAGPAAVPFVIEALSHPGISPEDQSLLIGNLGRLDASAIPPLIATLDSPDGVVATAAATALGRIGDSRAVSFLTYPAGSATSSPALRQAAQEAIARITRQPYLSSGKSPSQTLASAAWNYHRHQVELGDEPVVVWTWDKERKLPVSQNLTRSQAETFAGLRLAKEALRLDPLNRDAQIGQISLALDKAIEKVGYQNFATVDEATFAAATASGPLILSEVLKTAIADGKTDLAAVTVQALAKITERSALAVTGRPHPLVDALYAPGRRVQMAAAKALVNLSPTQPFPGSSRIVPTLARFVINQSLPRAIVIDGNMNRGSQIAGFLIGLGYDPELEVTGSKGFQAATETADVELIFVSFDLFRPSWSLRDTIANLEADARSARIPLFVYGPLDLAIKRPNLVNDYPRVRLLVTPTNQDTLAQQLTRLPKAASAAERTADAREAGSLLARIATEGKGPMVADLAGIEPALSIALAESDTASSAAETLGDVPDPDAQRSLIAIVLDPSQATKVRTGAAFQVVRSIRRFGPLVSAGQETQLASRIPLEMEPEIRRALESIVKALVPPREKASRPTIGPIGPTGVPTGSASAPVSIDSH